MILPDTNSRLDILIKDNIKNIKHVQKEIRFYVESPGSFPKCVFLAISSIFAKRSEKIIGLYTKQYYNVSSLNRRLPEATYSYKKELGSIEKKIDQLYSNLSLKSEESGAFENEIIATSAELTNLKADSKRDYGYMMRKSSLKRKLAKAKQSLVMSKDFLSDVPKEISLFESQQKILHDSISRYEYILQKSRHIESILACCLAGIRSVTQKRDLMLELGVAFTNIQGYVSSVTDYTANELINAASNFTNNSTGIDLALEGCTYNIDALDIIEEFE